MISTRARGLANLHAGVTTVCVGLLFWGYAEFVMRYVPVIRLVREVNLAPYFLCMIGGIALSARDLARLATRLRGDPGEAARLAARQVGLMAALTFAMMFATQDTSISRLFLGTFLVGAWVPLTVLNSRLPRLLARLVFQREQQLRTVFIGRLGSLARLDDWIADKAPLGVSPVGLLSDDDPVEGLTLPAPLLGRSAELARVLAEHDVGQVIVLELPQTDADARALIEICQEQGCRLLIHNDLPERYAHALVPITEDGRHFYTLQEEPLEDPLNRMLKRAFDIAVAFPMVVLVLPPLSAWVWLMHRFQSPGPLIYARERRGQGGRPFSMLKFRSMHVAPPDPAAEARQATARDNRTFPFGAFMRRRSLDEFPQFWNVLVGEMSVVGPRPYMPLLDEEFRRQTRGYRTRHLVKPGITGLAQSLGLRGEIIEKEMLSRRVYWDIYYITHWTIWMDIQITARTLWQMVWPPATAY